MRPSNATFMMIFGVLHLAIVGNLLLAIGTAPLWLLLITTDPQHSWPVLVLVAPLAGVVLSGMFSAFREWGAGETAMIAGFGRGVRATWRRALPASLAGTALATVALADIGALAAAPAAVLAVPALAVLAVLAVLITLTALVTIAEDPSARLRDVYRVAAYVSVRRWYLSLLSLAACGVQAGLFVSTPALALGLTATPVLYLLWSNARASLRPVLRPAASPAAVAVTG